MCLPIIVFRAHYLFAGTELALSGGDWWGGSRPSQLSTLRRTMELDLADGRERPGEQEGYQQQRRRQQPASGRTNASSRPGVPAGLFFLCIGILQEHVAESPSGSKACDTNT